MRASASQASWSFDAASRAHRSLHRVGLRGPRVATRKATPRSLSCMPSPLPVGHREGHTPASPHDQERGGERRREWRRERIAMQDQHVEQSGRYDVKSDENCGIGNKDGHQADFGAASNGKRPISWPASCHSRTSQMHRAVAHKHRSRLGDPNRQRQFLEQHQLFASCSTPWDTVPSEWSSLPQSRSCGRRVILRQKSIMPRIAATAMWFLYCVSKCNFADASHSTIVGQGVCKATGTTHFTVTCSKGGLYLSEDGKSAYRRCAPILCHPFVLPENSVAKSITPGADPAKLKLGDEIEVVCNVGYVQRGPVGVTNRTVCSRDPVCTLAPTTTCVYDTFCPVSIDPNSIASARWWDKQNLTEREESRNGGEGENESFIFNRQKVLSQCNHGFRSSRKYLPQSPWMGDGACHLNHSVLCKEQAPDEFGTIPTEGKLEDNLTCIHVTCPVFKTHCMDARLCGPDFKKEVATVIPNTTLKFNENATVRCNQGYYLPISAAFRANCSTAYSSGVLLPDYNSSLKSFWRIQCSQNCNYNAPPRPCEPLPCPCLQVPANARSSKVSLNYHESATYTCNQGFAISGTTSEQCLKSQNVKCSLYRGGLSALPKLDADLCSLAPCGRYPYPPNSGTSQVADIEVHGENITVTCQTGHRATLSSHPLADCSHQRHYTPTCDDCKWLDQGLTCRKVYCKAPMVHNGFTSANQSIFGQSMTVTCNQGYRPDSTNVDAIQVKSIACLDTCLHGPTIACLPVLARPSFNSLLGNATYGGLSTWTGNLEINETGVEIQLTADLKNISLYYGGRAVFVCNHGYVATGSGISSCSRTIYIDALADGSLRGKDRYCRPYSCSGSIIALASSVVPHSFEFGQYANVTCQAGHRASPKNKNMTFANCNDDRHFSVRCMSCEIEANDTCLPVRCDTTNSVVIAATQSISKNLSSIIFSDTVEVHCHPGYRVNTHDKQGNSMAAATCEENCQLSKNLSCLPIQCNMSVVNLTNAGWAANESCASGMYFGDIGRIVCDAGYITGSGCLNSFMVGCASNGTIWNSHQSCSNPTSCPLPSLNHSAIAGTNLSRTFGLASTINVTCKAGYGAQPLPSKFAPCSAPTFHTMQCSNDCSFSGIESCVPYRCSLSNLTSLLSGTGVMTHALLEEYAYSGETVNISCNKGYTVGSATSRVKQIYANCSASVCGSFGNNGASFCVPLTCDASLLNTENATLTAFDSNTSLAAMNSVVGSLKYHESATYTCNQGFILSGGGRRSHRTSFTSSCGDDGLMSGGNQSCVPISCTDSLDESSEQEISSRHSANPVYNDVVNVTCKNGYRSSNTTFSTCQSGLAYSGRCGSFEIVPLVPNTSCKRLVCDGLTGIRNQLAGKGYMSSSNVNNSAAAMYGGDQINISCGAQYSFGTSVSGSSFSTVTCGCPWTPGKIICVLSGCSVRNFTGMMRARNADVTSLGVTGNETSVTPGTNWTISCKTGYYLRSGPANSTHYVTSFHSTCGQNLLMTNLNQSCTIMTCPAIADPNSVSVQMRNGSSVIAHGEQITVECLAGFRAAAVQTLLQLVRTQLVSMRLVGILRIEGKASARKYSVTCHRSSLGYKAGVLHIRIPQHYTTGNP